MVTRNEILIAASEKYRYFEAAMETCRAVGIRYAGKFSSEETYLAVIVQKVTAARDDVTLERVLVSETQELFADTHNMWLRAADSNLNSTKSRLPTYQQRVDGKQNNLSTIAAAPASDLYVNKLASLTNTLKIQRDSPPRLDNPLMDDWDAQLTGVRNANTEIASINTDMADWITKAEKESRERKADRRSKFMAGWSFIGGGGIVGVLTTWDKLEVKLRALLGF